MGYFASNVPFMTVDMGVWNFLADWPIYQQMRCLLDRDRSFSCFFFGPSYHQVPIIHRRRSIWHLKVTKSDLMEVKRVCREKVKLQYVNIKVMKCKKCPISAASATFYYVLLFYFTCQWKPSFLLFRAHILVRR